VGLRFGSTCDTLERCIEFLQQEAGGNWGDSPPIVLVNSVSLSIFWEKWILPVVME
jgi:hypothetical protein